MPVTTKNSPVFEVASACFEVPRLTPMSRLIDTTASRKVLASLEIGNRTGCYIFAVAKGKRFEPWYVGKATRSFAQEVFNDSNARKYMEAMELAKTGRPVVLFVCHPKQKGALNRKAIDKLESMLVEECGGQNPNIRNARKSLVYRTIIKGVVNSGQGKPTANAVAIRRMMGRD
jgi:hypothetical protein